MTITYLQELERLNSFNLQTVFPNEPLPLSDIIQLEQLYNNGNIFPKALRELLYIAGKECSVMGMNNDDNPFTFQLEIRSIINSYGQTFARPFFAFDQIDRSLFSAVFLDMQTDDPVVMHYALNEDFESNEYVINSGFTLSKLINNMIENIKLGYGYL